MVYALDLKSSARKGLWVRVPLSLLCKLRPLGFMTTANARSIETQTMNSHGEIWDTGQRGRAHLMDKEKNGNADCKAYL